MRSITLALCGIFLAIIAGGCTIKTEITKYDVVTKDRNYELRDYAPCAVAETVVTGTLEDAGNKAFHRLFAYISGKNQARQEIAMTAPVSQQQTSQKIPMTAPVEQRRIEEGWAVTFAMPSSYTMESLPVPNDPEVKLRWVPARTMAAVKYSGTWSKKHYLHYLGKLESWIEAQGFSAIGEPIWARYNPPFTLWFLRRNEILIPVGMKTD